MHENIFSIIFAHIFICEFSYDIKRISYCGLANFQNTKNVNIPKYTLSIHCASKILPFTTFGACKYIGEEVYSWQINVSLSDAFFCPERSLLGEHKGTWYHGKKMNNPWHIRKKMYILKNEWRALTWKIDKKSKVTEKKSPQILPAADRESIHVYEGDVRIEWVEREAIYNLST